jgi:hypothetical protein
MMPEEGLACLVLLTFSPETFAILGWFVLTEGDKLRIPRKKGKLSGEGLISPRQEFDPENTPIWMLILDRP